MKIAFVSTLKSSSWGGSEELWNLSAIEAIEQGNQVGIFVYDWNQLPAKVEALKKKGANIFKRARQVSVVKKILKKIGDQLGISHPNYLNPYKNLIKYKPDIVVITDGATYYAANDPWLSKILNHHFAQQFVIVCQGNTPYHIPSDRTYASNLFKKAKKIVFVSERNRLECFHQLGQKLDNSMVIQNPINLPVLEPLPLPSLKEGNIHCAIVGRLSISDKGQDMIIAMMADPFWKNANIHLHIYGSGDDKQYLADLINYYGVEDKVTIEGFLDPISIYKKCHCLIMLSLQEGTSLAMLEAMALGRVCIVSDVGGSSEWIDDGQNGYLVEAPTVPLLDRKLKTALENSDKWPEIGEHAHRKIMKNIDQFPGQTLYNIL